MLDCGSTGFPCILLDQSISLIFQFTRQFLSAGPNDAASRKHVYLVGNYVVEQTLIVRDDNDGSIGVAERK